MPQTYESLLANRSYNGKPHFWDPKPIEKVPHSLLFDEDLVCENEWGVDEAIQRTLALGLFLELPVGEWVLDGRKRELNNLPESAKILLQTNIADEAKHDKGFRLANEAYFISKSVLSEAQGIANEWLSNVDHPLVKARNAETGVFLPAGLAILRLVGGKSLSDMAEQIARDESRHVTTNELAIRDLGFNPGSPTQSIRELIKVTLDWLVGDLNVPSDEIGELYDFNKAFIMEESDNLIERGIAPRMNLLFDVQINQSPMEMSNSSLYQRTVD